MTTQNLLTEWLEIYQKEHIKARTYSRYQGLITMHIVPMLGYQNRRRYYGASECINHTQPICSLYVRPQNANFNFYYYIYCDTTIFLVKY